MKKLGLVLALAAMLAYLRDPAWLDGMSSGLRAWEQAADGHRYRWSGGHAAFFVPSGAAAFDLPLSTTFNPGDAPLMVTVTVDDRPGARLLLTDAKWQTVTILPSARTTRHVRRIDVRTSITRDDNHGVRIGEIAVRNASLGSAR